MPWYRTQYKTRGMFRDRDMSAYIYADTVEQANDFIVARKLDEVLYEEVTHNVVPYIPPSIQLEKDITTKEQFAELMHAVCWLSFLWAKSKPTVSLTNLVGDDGILHDVIHCIHLQYPKDRVIKMLQQIEQSIPGYLKQ